VAHKGINAFTCRVHGRSSHSSLTPQGCNAIEHAARLICAIRDFADAYKVNGPYDQFYDVPFSTMTTNQIRGGIAINTIPDLCEFTYEFRNLPGMSPEKIQSQIEQYAREHVLPKMQAEYPDARIDIGVIASGPALEAAEQDAITALVRALTGDREQRKVAYATEAGLFQQVGIPTIVCGPGDIIQAHKPNEFVAIAQLQRCEEFLRKLGHSLQAA
jgi:acetylornithine deacetylase